MRSWIFYHCCGNEYNGALTSSRDNSHVSEDFLCQSCFQLVGFNQIEKGQKQSHCKECGWLFHNEGHHLKKKKTKKKQDQENECVSSNGLPCLSPQELLYFNHQIVLGLLFAV